MALGEIGGTGEPAFGARVEEDFKVHFPAGGVGGEFVGVVVADRWAAGFLNPDFEVGLEMLFEARVGASPLASAEDGFGAADANEYAHEWQRVRL